MEASTSLNLNSTLSVCPSQKTKPFQIPLAALSFETGKKKKRLRCLKVGRAEMKLEEGEDEWMMGLGKWCQEKKGAVDRLECLEREAINGQDEGKHPTDYQRRAHIFDKSSRVFQALKERSAALNPSP